MYDNLTARPKADHQCRLSERDQAMSRLITKTWANFVKLVDVYISINVNRVSLLKDLFIKFDILHMVSHCQGDPASPGSDYYWEEVNVFELKKAKTQ